METANIEIREHGDRQSLAADERLDSLKCRKALAKTAFTKAKNQVLRLLEEECIEISDRNRVKEACEKLTIKQEQLMEIFEALIGEYSTRTDRQNRTKTIEEIEKMEHDFSEVINRAQQARGRKFIEQRWGKVPKTKYT